MRDALIILAAGAAGTAFTVFGINTNRPLGAFLIVGALALWLIGLNDAKAKKVWRSSPKTKTGVVLLVLAFIGTGVYLAATYNAPEQSNTDDVARTRAESATTQSSAALQQISDLTAKVSALEAQVTATMQFQTAEKTTREQADASRVEREMQLAAQREALGRFIVSGRRVQLQCGNETVPPPDAAANKWAAEVEKYLTDQLGESYVARFRSHSGLPMTANSIQSIPHRNLWSGLDTRLARLEQFVQELSKQ